MAFHNIESASIKFYFQRRAAETLNRPDSAFSAKTRDFQPIYADGTDLSEATVNQNEMDKALVSV